MTYILSSRATPSRRVSVLQSIAVMFDIWRQRRALSQLDAARLRDIGLNVQQAHAEANRPIWDVPQTWRC